MSNQEPTPTPNPDGKSKTIHIMSPSQARQHVVEMRCATCYGLLTTRYDWRKQVSEVTCITEGCPCDGFVTADFIELLKARSAAEAQEAKVLLAQAAPWLKPAAKSKEQLLKELGF